MKKLIVRIIVLVITDTGCHVLLQAQDMDLVVIGHPKGVPADLNFNMLRSVF